jgi:UDP-sugar pyrophosphorylase
MLRQELVPALTDNQAHLALGKPYELLMKPHGHGDIHMLLHQSGLARQLSNEGIEHLVFVQDTNGQVFNAVPAALGVACEQAFDFTSLAVNRIPGEAVGGLAKLVWPDRTKTLNVEYNQLDPLLRATVNPAGDLPNEEGYSFFPGNINVLIIALRAYVEVLEQSQGIIAEFVNPKYADAQRSHFKKPTRLETMMQDLPKLFERQERVGVAIFDRTWSFSANKNSVADAAVKQRGGGPAESAATAEADFYAAGRARLRAAGFEVAEQAPCCVQDISFVSGPQVILRPSFAMSIHEVREKTAGGVLEAESTLILDGADITLGRVELAAGSALIIEAVPGAQVYVEGRFENKGFERVLLSAADCQDESIPETVRMRGYRYEDRGAAIYRFDTPGVYRIEP